MKNYQVFASEVDQKNARPFGDLDESLFAKAGGRALFYLALFYTGGRKSEVGSLV